jgi:DNA repair protein RecO (recombination protein O)
MALLTTEALVLRGYKLGETSKLVVLLTRERGKLRAVARGARGARPRYQSALEPLSEVRATLYGRQGSELLRLGNAELLHSAFRAGTRSLDAALLLSGCAELLDAFCPEGEAEDKVYRLALAVVRATEAGACPELLGRYVEAWLLRLHGLQPPLDACGPAGGPVLSAAACDLLAEFQRVAPESLSGPAGPECREIESFLRERITAHLERDLRAPRVVRETRKAAS